MQLKNDSATPYKVSILVPVYGVEKYIVRCAKSLFEQTYADIEFIFVDDCSPDRSIELLQDIIKVYLQRQDSIRIIHHNENKGLGEARNTAVAAATGKFLMHVDSDDYIDKTCVEKCVKKQVTTDADIVGFDVTYIKRKGTSTSNKIKFKDKNGFLNELISETALHTIWGNFIRTSLYKDNKIYVEGNVNMSEDFQVFPRLVYYSKKYEVINEPMYYYDLSNQNSYNSLFSVKNDMQEWKTLRVLQDFFKGKSDNIMESLNICVYKSAVKAMVCSAMVNNYQYYLLMKQKTVLFSPTYRKCLTLPYRIGVYIENFALLSIYAKFSHFIRSFIFRRR